MALLITENDVAVLLTMEDCISGLEAAFKRQDEGLVMNHPRRRLHAPDGSFQIMEAADLGLKRMAIKAYTVFRPAARFLIMLYDTTNGDLLAMIEGDRLGQMRTGAATGVATKYMARKDADVLGLIGTGWQAETQALAVAAVRKIRRVQVYSRSVEKRNSFAERMGRQLGVEAVAMATPEDAVRGAGIVVTATTSRKPVFDGSALEPGTHINAVGSNSLAKAELDIMAVSRAGRVVVDSIEQSRMESGDLLAPLEARKFRWELALELREVVSGRFPGRVGAEEITLFKSNGLALEDVVAASIVYDAARERGVGTEIGLWQ